MAARKRKVSSPLALAVLATLTEKPMHPYEMAATMRSRGKEHSIKLNYGSLYTVVDNLARHGLIEAAEARREGRRPERTVYTLTGPGRAELEDWMTGLLRAPVKEYPQFEAALSLLPVLSPDEVTRCLRQRVGALEEGIAQEEALLASAGTALPRLMLLENEYHLALARAELAWVRALASELAAGTFPGQEQWAHWHRTGEQAPEVAELSSAAVAEYLARDGDLAGGQPVAAAGEEPPAGT